MRLPCLIMTLLLAGWSSPSSAEIASGARSYTKTFDGEAIRLYTYRPNCSSPDLLFIFHGSSRNADDYRDYGKRLADAECLVVVAPHFTSSAFSNDEYQRGGLLDSRDRLLPENRWSTRLVEPMIAWAKGQIGGDPDTFLFGHSAGGQYLSRVTAYERPSGPRRIVVANPSTHVLPSLTEDVPYGFDGLGSSEAERAALREYLSLPVTVYLGADDDDPNADQLASDKAAMRQGDDRRERGERTFAMAQRIAQENGWPFNWRLVIAPGVEHSASGMLRSSAATQAFGFRDPEPKPQPAPEPQPQPTPKPVPQPTPEPECCDCECPG